MAKLYQVYYVKGNAVIDGKPVWYKCRFNPYQAADHHAVRYMNGFSYLDVLTLFLVWHNRSNMVCVIHIDEASAYIIDDTKSSMVRPLLNNPFMFVPNMSIH